MIKKRGASRVFIGIGILGIVLIWVGISFFNYMKTAKGRLESYNTLVKTQETSYGKMSYIDEGEGEVILVCHGLFGGYDQGYDSLQDMVGTYRIIAPSRFGYTGTDMPKNATVKDQAHAYIELLDKLGIDKVYVLGTSAGGLCALRMGIEYPDRVKGVILYCSGGIAKEKPQLDEIPDYMAVPRFLCNDFAMWTMGPIMRPKMHASKEVWQSIFPVEIKVEGVVNDGYETNRDSDINFDAYKLEEMQVPVLALHAKDDKIASYNNVANIMERVPNGTFVSFETGGHMMKGDTQEVNAALIDFINKTKE